MTRPSTPANNPSSAPTLSSGEDIRKEEREARDGMGGRSAALPDAASADEQNLEPDHVEIVGEIDNESGDEDKAPTLSDERYRR